MSCWGVGALCKDGPGWHCSVPQLGCAVPRIRAWGLQKNSIPSASKLGEPSLLLLVRLGEVGKLLLLGETIPRKSLLNAGKRARIGLLPWHLLPWPFAMPRTGSSSLTAGGERCWSSCWHRDMVERQVLGVMALGADLLFLDPNHSCWPWQEAVSCS